MPVRVCLISALEHKAARTGWGSEYIADMLAGAVAVDMEAGTYTREDSVRHAIEAKHSSLHSPSPSPLTPTDLDVMLTDVRWAKEHALIQKANWNACEKAARVNRLLDRWRLWRQKENEASGHSGSVRHIASAPQR